MFTSSFTTDIECVTPSNISLTATPFSVTLSWDQLDGADSYKVVYKLPNSGWQNIVVTDNYLTLSHNGSGVANFYVRSNCSENYFSNYSSIQTIELPSCPSFVNECQLTSILHWRYCRS